MTTGKITPDSMIEIPYEELYCLIDWARGGIASFRINYLIARRRMPAPKDDVPPKDLEIVNRWSEYFDLKPLKAS